MVKTMMMTVKERLLVPFFYPEKGSMRELRIARDIARKVNLTPEERTEIGFVKDKEGMRWEKQTEKEIELNDDEREFLKRQVRRLDEEAAFTPDTLEMAERFINL